MKLIASVKFLSHYTEILSFQIYCRIMIRLVKQKQMYIQHGEFATNETLILPQMLAYLI